MSSVFVIQNIILITEWNIRIDVLRWHGGTYLPLLRSFTKFLFFWFFLSFWYSLSVFLIFQLFRCTGSLKCPRGLRVLAFVSHFLLKQFFFNPVRFFTVVVLALSPPSLFFPLYLPLLLSFLCQPEVNATLFSPPCTKAGGIFLVTATSK